MLRGRFPQSAPFLPIGPRERPRLADSFLAPGSGARDPRDYDAVAGPGSARTPVFFSTWFFFYQVAAGVGEDGALRVRRVGEPAGREVALAAEEVSIGPLGPAS